jgi:AbrB family looped-hinge helix DNA binding protein
VAKVTSKLQVTVPKAIADEFAIRPGDEIEWITSGDGIRVIKRAHSGQDREATLAARLGAFDEATKRQAARSGGSKRPPPGSGRGWTRQDLYRRGSSR